KMPVNGAARHARRGGDLGERAPRDATPAKHRFGRIEQLLARDRRIFLRPACHCLGALFRGACCQTLYKQSRLYVSFSLRTRRTATTPRRSRPLGVADVRRAAFISPPITRRPRRPPGRLRAETAG